MTENTTAISAQDDVYDDFENHYIDPVEIVSSCIFILIGLLTDAIYFRLLHYHWRNGTKTHYQKIFLICITNDISLHYTMLIRIRLPTWGVHEWYRYIMTGFFPLILAYLNGVFMEIQVLGTFLIASNRATAVAFPRGYEKVHRD
ncbi:unnamed protein product, partial [Mesorhabditis belari]|uniref:Uncharacterized protein n=1 Tax=Mesorhabditis belari TaxID=2138241 RepID=A0AAF3FQF5_9BILA